ncbi:MAG: THUMP domain-containing class I SAM-dependent RNA methyltransferase [Thermotogota bacterium]
MYLLLANTSLGLEKILKEELKDNGFKIKDVKRGMVYCLIDEKNIHNIKKIRTAERIYMIMKEFKFKKLDDYFDNIYNIEWNEYFGIKDKVIIDKVIINSKYHKSAKTFQSLTQKAVYKKMMDKYNIDFMMESNNEFKMRVFIFGIKAVIALDLSGEPLHKRNYKKFISKAPLKEHIASALILFSNWDKKSPLIDPFCGSGTIPLEAGLIAADISAGFMREYDYENMQKFSHYKNDSDKEINNPEIIGTDKEEDMIETSLKNYDNIKYDLNVSFYKSSMEKIKNNFSKKGTIITNPPYGVRLEDKKQAIKLVEQMRYLKKEFQGWELTVITSLKNYEKYFDHKATKTIEIINGKIKSFIFNYKEL